MKIAAVALACLALGLSIGRNPATVHAQPGMRSAHIIEVNMDLSTGREYLFNGTPVSVSCFPGKGSPDCFVLVQGN